MEITLDLIQKLRERTGLGMMDCKKSLVEANGDIEKAIELLRKKGSLVAEKRAGNKTSEGIVYSYIHAGSQIGVLIELNCETDFVAKTNDMKNLAHEISLHIVAMKPKYLSSEDVNTSDIEKEIEIQRALLEKQNKPANVIQGILDGKMKKYYSENCLLMQSFIKDDKITVQELIKNTISRVGENVKIGRFVRFEVGVN